MSRKAGFSSVAVALLAAAFAVWFFRLPAKGSIEYHVAGAREAGRMAYLMQAKPRQLRVLVRKLFHPNRTAQDYGKEHEQHLLALVELGYLERRSFVFSNEVPTVKAWMSVLQAIPPFCRTNQGQFEITYQPNSNALMITARPELMPAWEEFAKEYDRKLGAEAAGGVTHGISTGGAGDQD
ncbi:MAG: hypothetical protein KDM81_01070 [Verrucomicrobiae bacterium]|nr:hypothetical protein [Verrucomicrobiae bacterium]MCP5515667.1 hypothetical protein [Verrucomicrobiales bacterium]MCP5522694.1 hypothetical protein [Verrucomicrobiales bacterium]